jgi:hypothetical protein
MIQTTKKDKWTDETGREIPLNYITPSLRLKERSAATLLKKAQSVEAKLAALKADFEKQSGDVFEKVLEEIAARGGNVPKGFTFFNFDRSIKVERVVNERTDFDDIIISACKDKLDEFLNANLDSKTEFIKDLVTDAFSTSRGKLDAKKVLSLMKYKTKILDPLFQEALNLMSQAITRPGSKAYHKISLRDKNGEYKYVNLNFSSL